MRSIVTLLWLALVCLIPFGSAGADWPQWRGPNRDGISPETGLLKDWPTGGPKLLWTARGLGEGYSGVAVVAQQIFTIGDKGGRNLVVALNLDGKSLWQTPLGKGGAPGWGGYSGPRATPTAAGGLVFAVGQYGETACLDAATGAEKWRKDLQKDFGGELQEWGYTTMPLLDEERVILTSGGSHGNVIALEKSTGALIWQSTQLTDAIHYSATVLAQIGGVKQYIQLTERTLAGLSVENGKVLWRAVRNGSTAVIPTPIVSENYVYVTSSYGTGCNLFRINAAGGRFTPEQLYASKVMVNHHGGVVKVGDFVYGYSEGKGWTCQSFKSGQTVWTERSQLGKGSITYADGRFYLRTEEGKGTVALIEASPAGYKEHGRFDPPNRTEMNSWPHPVISGGRLYLRDQDVLLCYDLKAK